MNNKRKRVTVTFQPEEDVALILASIEERGEVTRIVNEAIRKNHRAAVLNLALREKAALEQRIASLQSKS